MSSVPPRAAFHEAAAYLNTIGVQLNRRGLACQAVVSTGDAADVLLDEAKRLDADLIVLGTHGRSVLGRWMHGSVAETVLARSSVPVLLVRPGRPGGDSLPVPPVTSILVPLDGSPAAEAALPWATELAWLLSAEPHLVRIVLFSLQGALTVPRPRRSHSAGRQRSRHGVMRDPACPGRPTQAGPSGRDPSVPPHATPERARWRG